MKPGEERDINVTFPEEYHSEDLKGKEVVFKVKLNEVKIKKIMPLDDEFAKDISEFETLEELKQDVENRLTEMAKQENEQQIRNKVLDKVAENSQVEPPEAMVERKIDGLVKEMEYRMGQQGLTMEQYLGFTNNTIEQIRETYKADAEKNVKLDLVLEAIMKKEDLQVSEEEINKELETIAENNKQSVEEIKNILEAQGNLDRFKENVIFNKTLNMIVESASIVEPKDDEKEDDEVKDEK